MDVNLNDRQALLVLNALPNVGPITLNRLLAALGGDPRAVLSAEREVLQAVRGVGPVIADTLMEWRAHFDPQREEERMAVAGVEFITPQDAAYPALLREIHDPPIGLYAQGGVGDGRMGRRGVAIVGSRRTTHYGLGLARAFATELVRQGFMIVSGLARGIDTAAHQGALDAGGVTVAVLGTGIDRVYPPENLDLRRRIAAEGGAVLSEFPLGRRADRQSFAMRNRIVAGMCEATVVVESDVDGGAMITARFAGEQGRLLFAVPGRVDQPTSAGCHQLLRDGATLMRSVDDLLEELGYLNGLRPAPIAARPAEVAAGQPANLTADEAAVYAQFAGGEILGPDALGERTGLAPSGLAAALMILELKRAVVKRADGSYEGI
jgi:DNA processing protein